MAFFWGNHLTQDVPRGPFSNSHDWIRARLTFILNNQERILRDSDDEDDIEDATNIKELAQRLLELLPRVFPSGASSSEPTVLFHDDLNLLNMLVEENEELTAVIDWECVSALPLWKVCQVPKFLEGRERNEEPCRDRHGVDELEDNEESGSLPEALDDEGVASIYWEHLMEYEQTQLRHVFIETIEELEPLWMEESRKGAAQADFEDAVQHCDAWGYKIVKNWLDTFGSGESWSLRSRLLA
ncbi:hypothetical protein H2199_004027 [Coniosporium tulheliwenetii]|uniref:Uncharacterized protein n=1 Tax=Coniosporium tulheliwenetii TaxID=3383036 RepID=A0ACC2Z727_9PEZI|nr:hypothetical protein H2199_004027 [Cladosporium sp. JES 115]